MNVVPVKFVTALPTGQKCVGMVVYKDTVLVATEQCVYKLVDDVLYPLSFCIKEG